jgi:hypothetical protein
MADITRPRNLTPKRRHRTYPRVVKRGRHNSYRVKRSTDIGFRTTGRPQSGWSTSAPAILGQHDQLKLSGIEPWLDTADDLFDLCRRELGD